MVNEYNNPEINNRYTQEEEREIALQIAQGNLTVRAKFIEDNLGLAKSFALSYVNKYPLKILTLDDLIQDASIGLIRAVDKFDGSKGYKFSTYASYWIKQAIDEAILTKDKGISLSKRNLEKVRKLKGVEGKLENVLNRKPTLEELAKELNMSKRKTEEIYQYQFDTVSLNECINEDKYEELGDFFFLDAPSPEETAIHSNMKSVVENLIEDSKLTEVEKSALILYYFSGMSYVKIGEILGCSRQTVKNKINIAMMKFRRRKDMKSYAVYMDNPSEAEKNIDFFKELYEDPKYRTGEENVEKILSKRQR